MMLWAKLPPLERNLNLLEILNYASIALGLIATIGGGFAWYGSKTKKEYAAERDFRHLNRNFEALSAALKQLMDEEDDRYERLRDRIDAQNGILSEIRLILLTKLDGSTLGDRSQ